MGGGRGRWAAVKLSAINSIQPMKKTYQKKKKRVLSSHHNLDEINQFHDSNTQKYNEAEATGSKAQSAMRARKLTIRIHTHDTLLVLLTVSLEQNRPVLENGIPLWINCVSSATVLSALAFFQIVH